MDQRVVEQKLESLRKCIKRLQDKTPDEPSTLESDIDLQDILSVNLERAVQQCVDNGAHIIASLEIDAPDTMAKTFDLLHQTDILTANTAKVMKKTVGFRNIAVHNYQKIDWTIVFNICTRQIDFTDFADEINTYISDQ